MKISVVIPVYNEEGNLRPLFDELSSVMQKNYAEFEAIFVDDGSTDSSLDILKDLRKSNSSIKIIEFEGNFGQTDAIQAGLDYAKGDIIVTMDSDMQNDPKDIPRLINELESSGSDMVSGWRNNRQDDVFKRMFSGLASKLRSVFLGTDLHDYGCTLKAFNRKSAKSLNLNGEMHRYIPPLLKRNGYNVSEIKVNHRERYSGETSYGLRRLPKGFVDMINVWFWKTYDGRPLHVFGGLGLFSMFSGGLFFLLAIYQKLNGTTFTDTAATTLSVFLILIGVQFFISGILADIAIRNGRNSSGKPVYNVKEIIE